MRSLSPVRMQGFALAFAFATPMIALADFRYTLAAASPNVNSSEISKALSKQLFDNLPLAGVSGEFPSGRMLQSTLSDLKLSSVSDLSILSFTANNRSALDLNAPLSSSVNGANPTVGRAFGQHPSMTSSPSSNHDFSTITGLSVSQSANTQSTGAVILNPEPATIASALAAVPILCAAWWRRYRRRGLDA